MLQFAIPCTLGAIGLFLGSANTIYQLPPLVLLFPACLYFIGIQADTPKIAFRRGMLAGTLGYTLCFYWIALPLTTQAAMPWALAAPAPVVIAAIMALYSGLFSWFCRKRLTYASPLFAGISTGIMWGFLELARETLLTGFPWASLSAGFAAWPAFIQPLSFVGAEAYSGILAGLTCYLTAAARNSSIKHTVSALACIAMLFTASYYSWIQPADSSANVEIAMVQGNIDQGVKWNAAYQKGTVSRYMTLSSQVLKRPVDLVIWPETSMPFYVQTSKKYLPLLRRMAVESNTAYLIGTPGFGKGTEGRKWDLYNRAYLIEPDGVMKSWYDKVHLVPFGEYIPFDIQIPYLGKLLDGTGTFRSGVVHHPLTVGNLALGVLICYETIFTELAQERVANGANVLVNISNDAWFGRTSAPKQHLDLAVLRAVEQGRYIARATNTGITAIIDPKGNITTEGKSFQASVIFGSVGTRTDFTFYHRFFSVIRLLLLAGGLLLLIHTYLKSKNKDKKYAPISRPEN